MKRTDLVNIYIKPEMVTSVATKCSHLLQQGSISGFDMRVTDKKTYLTMSDCKEGAVAWGEELSNTEWFK